MNTDIEKSVDLENKLDALTYLHDALIDTEPADGWLICCEIVTAELTALEEQAFLKALREIVFYSCKNHTVRINDFVTGIEQDAFYELLDSFNLNITR